MLAFGTGYAAVYLNPIVYWWAALVASALPYLAIALVIISPIVLWRFDWIGRALHLTALVLVVLRFVVPSLPPGASPAGPGDLVVTTFNAPVRGPHPDSLAAATVEVVRREAPDLLALQEPVVWWDEERAARRATSHAQALLDSLGYRIDTPTDMALSTERFSQPVLVSGTSSLEVQSVSQVILPPAAGSVSPTAVTRLQFSWQDRTAVLFNVHLHTTGERKPWQDEAARPLELRFWRPYVRRYRQAFRRRVHEVEQVRRLVEAETLPVLLVGDFNSTVHHWEHRFLARGLQNAFTRRGVGWGATYHSRLPLVRIDHILAGPQWTIVSARVPAAHAYSDHRPLTARLRWRD